LFPLPQDGLTNLELVDAVGDEKSAKTRLKALEALMVQRQASNKKKQGGFEVGEIVEWQKLDKKWVEAVVVGTTDQQVYLVSKDEAVPENIGSCQRKKSALVKRKEL
jgi:hypothetical protein